MIGLRKAAGAAFIISVAAMGMSGCLNNYGASGRFTTAGGTDDVEQSNPFAGGSANSSLITLTRVVKSSLTPTATLDLYGDGTGAFGNYCVSTGGGAGDAGPSTCGCTYNFTRADGNTEEANVDTTYREDNMIRCDYSTVPADVTVMRVKVKLINVGAYSNELTFRFSGGAGTVSPSDSATFVRAQRYQCKQMLFIPHPFDPNVIDPFMSESSEFAFMANFYTSNMGQALAHFANPSRASFDGGAQAENGWICPTTPNDSSFGADLTLYSVAHDGTGNYKIFPPSDPSRDRSTFYLAKEATGVFTVPFHTATIPGEFSSTTDAARLKPMGYGAAPIRGSVDGEETCPGSDAVIPSGYKWVKVWSFRGSRVDRARVTSSHFSGIDGIGCNPGLWVNQAADGTNILEPVIPACGSTNQQAGQAVNNASCSTLVSTTMPTADGTVIADRFIANIGGDNKSAQCARVDPGGTTDSTYDLYDTYAVLVPGVDTWRRYTKVLAIPPTGTAGLNACNRYTLSGAGATYQTPNTAIPPDDCSDPFNFLNLCPGSTVGTNYGSSVLTPNPTGDADSQRRPASPDGSAKWTNPDWPAPWTLADSMTIMTGTAYTDLVYVVTPTNVTTNHMLEESETGEGAKYRPFRFFSGADCSSSNPHSPSIPGDCPANRRLDYEFVNRDNTQVDPSVGGGDPNQVRGYPICALQPL